VAVGRLRSRLNRLLRRRRSNIANRRLADHLAKHREELFRFLLEPGVDATNWRAEQALRPAVVNRKTWGGNRTWAGAAAQSVLMSVLQTCRLQGCDVLDFISQILCVLRRPQPALQPRGP
jgi:transposase